MAPLISIVIPAFNHGRFLNETLWSVRHQSFADWECVVVDDGSADDTFAVARAHAESDRRIQVAHTENRGPSGARNHGYVVSSAKTEFVTFMDSDDVWLPHALEVLLSRLNADTQAIGAHGLAEMIDESGEPVRTWSHSDYGKNRLGLDGKHLVHWPLDKPTDFDVLINGTVLFPPGLLLSRRDAYDKAGKFDELFRGTEDWDMLIRLSRYGYLSFVNTVILHYRRHRSNMGAASGIDHQAWLVRCKAFHSPDNNALHRDKVRRGWKAYQRYMINERMRVGREHLKAGRIFPALRALSRIPVHGYRFARGYPTPKLVRASEPWN